MISKDFFFCYDEKLAKHLKLNCGISYITNSIHKDTGNEFWLFPKSKEVRMRVREWKEKMNK